MGCNVLDMILVEDLVTVPTSINTNYVTEIVDMTFREAEFAIQINYDQGINVDMTFFIEVSLDGENFSQIPDSRQDITDPSGTHIWSIGGEGASFLRVGVEVRSGSISTDRISVHMRRRH